jgi:hypothetical protein
VALLSRAARNSPDGVPTRQALALQARGGWLSHLPLFRALSPGLPRPRPGRAAGAALGVVPARTLPAKRKHVRHRPAPLPRPNRLMRTSGTGPRPGGWLCTTRRCAARQRNHVGHRLPESHALRRDATTGAFPPAWLETFAIHPAAGADRVWHGIEGCGQNGGILWGKVRDCWGGGVGMCT